MNSKRHTIEANAKAPPFAILCESITFIEAAADATGDAALPKLNIIAYTGGKLNLAKLQHPLIVDLAGLSISAQATPIRRNHDPNQGVGHTTRLVVEAGRLIAEGVVSRDTEAAKEVTKSGKQGFPWQASIGADPVAPLEFVAAGKSVSVNGQTFKGPVLVSRQTILGEISCVDRGADFNGTEVRIAAAFTSKQTESIMDFAQWLTAKGFDINTISAAQKTSLQAMFDAERAGATGGNAGGQGGGGEGGATGGTGNSKVGNLKSVIEAAAAETARRNKIAEVTADVLTERPELHGELLTLSNAAIEAAWTAEKFELEATRLQRKAPEFMVRQQREIGNSVIEAAMCRSAGLAGTDKAFDDKTLESADKNFRNGIGLKQTMMLCAQANGYRGSDRDDIQGIFDFAFRAPAVRRSGIEAAASSLSLPNILSNVANKFLVAGFNSVESGWRQISKIASARDFKTNTYISLGGDYKYKKIGPDGELKHAKPSETPYTAAADTFGRIIGITRKHLVNDDLGAFSDIQNLLGRGGALAINSEFWTSFLDDSAFFTSGNANYITGATTNLSAAGLTAARLALRRQTDPNGNPLGADPKVILVPPDLEDTAWQLTNSTQINTGGSSSVAQVPNLNYWKGLTPVSSAYLTAAKVWYLMVDPMALATMTVVFLNGREAPVIEQAEADFNTLGVQFRAYHDFGVAKREYRAGVKSKGEA